MQVSHQEMKEYLLYKNTSAIYEQIEKLMDEDPTYQLLFQIIDKLKEKVSVSEQNIQNETLSFPFIEEIILKTFSNNIKTKEAEIALNSIYHSEGNYQRLLVKLKQLVPAFNEEPVPELDKVYIKSDNEILDQVLNIPSEKKQIEKYLKGLSHLWNKIKNIQLFGNRMIPKYAFAFVIIFLITIGIRFGISYYHTTYQISSAVRLLNKNYKIYITDSPRLTGNYKSTGISTLLSAGVNNQLYLDQALKHIKKALIYDDQLDQANLLKAQIYIINKDFLKADSILNQIDQKTAGLFNDQGVLNFLKEDLTTAIKYFKLSIRQDKNFKEAYYNLAITEYKLKNKDAALAYIKKYLSLEDDEEWRNAALNLFNQIK